jgi:uncharacterized membrane protein
MSETAPFDHPHKRLERMVFFSDAVFAIAITLLMLELKIPDRAGLFRWSELDELTPRFISCATTYGFVGLAWWSHTRICRRLIDADGRLMAINLARLFFITLLPIPTTALMEHGGSADSWAFYAVVMALSNFAELRLWLYASRRPELCVELPDRERRKVAWRSAFNSLAFVVSIGAAYLRFDLGWIVLTLLLVPGQWLLSRL